MKITHFNYDPTCQDSTIKSLDVCLKELCDKNIKTTPENSVYYSDTFDSIDKITSKYGIYIWANSPHKSVDKLIELPDIPSEHIITVIGESKLLYTSKFSMMLSKFLFNEAYLTKKQSQQYFTVLQESLINAIEHGNLGLSDKKKFSIKQDKWFDEFRNISEEFLHNQAAGEKLVVVQCRLEHENVITSVIDEGDGFDIDNKKIPEEESLSHGRGLDLIKGIADKLNFKNGGNCLEFNFKACFLENRGYDTELSISNLRSKSKVLIVDDQLSNLKVAELHLKSAGYKNIILATSGEEALEICKNLMPDIIILDVIMPKMDGFTTCRKIKQSRQYSNIPILFFTGLDDSKNRIKGYRLGAVDYVTKPIQRTELVARADSHIQNSILFQRLNENYNRIQKDLKRAKASQLDLLPSKDVLDSIQMRYGVEITSSFDTCTELAGDYWTTFDIGSGKLGFILADFTGHGIAASLNTVRLHSLILDAVKLYSNPINFVMHINERLKDLIPIEDFATFVYAILDITTGELSYIGCGNPPIAIIPKNKADGCRYLKCEGLPLGLINSSELTLNLKKTTLEDGDSIFLFSDALLETIHTDTGKMWCEADLLTKMNHMYKQNSNSNLRDILNMYNYTSQKPLKDDLTLVYINYKGDNLSKGLPRNYNHPDAILQELTG
tara:strand:+ start:121199 stop:123202 length:2004 start_codon:yes stop_codon:yes gene_type:complete